MLREGTGKPRDIEQIHQADLVHAGTIAGQVTVHGLALETFDGAGRLAEASRIHNDQVIVFGDRLCQGEAQCSAVEVGYIGRIRVVLLEVAYDMDTDALVRKQVVADAEYEGATHEQAHSKRGN